MRQELPEIPASAVPYGQDNLRKFTGPSVFSTEILRTYSCGASFGFAWQRNLVSDSHTSFRERFSHNENFAARTISRGYGHKYTTGELSRNDLSGEFRVARTSRPRDPIAAASFRLGLCLRVSYLLSRSVRIPQDREND